MSSYLISKVYNFTFGIVSNTSLVYIKISTVGFWYFQLRNVSYKREHMRPSLIVWPKMPVDWKEEAEVKNGLPLQPVTWWWEGTASYYSCMRKKKNQCPKFYFLPIFWKKLAHYNRVNGCSLAHGEESLLGSFLLSWRCVIFWKMWSSKPWWTALK